MATLGVGETPLLVLNRTEDASPRHEIRPGSSTMRSRSPHAMRLVLRLIGFAIIGRSAGLPIIT